MSYRFPSELFAFRAQSPGEVPLWPPPPGTRFRWAHAEAVARSELQEVRRELEIIRRLIKRLGTGEKARGMAALQGERRDRLILAEYACHSDLTWAARALDQLDTPGLFDDLQPVKRDSWPRG